MENQIKFDASEVLQKLAQLGSDEVKTKGAVNACRNAARIFANAARAKAPVYTGRTDKSYYARKRNPRKVGTLKASIYTKSSVRDRLTGQPSAQFGAADPVGHLVEYGHLTRGSAYTRTIRKGLKRTNERKGVRHTTARPFMRPAIAEKSAEAFKSIGDTIDRAITKALG